ncbi:hypothetical protein KDD30_05985 [Photobacterium sp. GJ3]|uniref:DUF6891 domain-containing protein n=1 Tax=Photobacterium sp. GJ3 TaxID=2829502 RepID=UPI001B8CA03D|nr:hypothetical protein [Photobacterium sp. GJ3]QUJ68657.1 hypothetical protein KDD30_05985 [Photobacterium sp. GJ3]
MKWCLFLILSLTSCQTVAMDINKNETNQSILEAIQVHVWGGFDTPDDVQSVISDLLEEGADENMLRDSVGTEFSKKLAAEPSWPEVTDVDRLKSVFQDLKNRGVLCLHNAGYTQSDGHEDAQDAINAYPKGTFFGYCFYHGQDVESALNGRGLYLAYAHLNWTGPEMLNVGQMIQQALERAGFVVDWNGSAEQRIHIPELKWQHRSHRSR